MKKVTSLFLCIILIFSLVSCASSAPEIVPEYDASVSEDDIDLGGKTLIMGMVQDYFFEGADSVLTYITNTEFGDLAAQRLKDVEEKYNCNIEFDYVPRAGQLAFNSAVAGTYIFDYIQEESYFLVNYIGAGAFVDLKTLDNIDVFDESKWGDRNMLVSTMFDGEIYGVLPAAHPLRVSNSMDGILFVNEDYISNILATDPRDYFENGEWNWETFTHCLETYAHTSGISNEYVYALSSEFGSFACCLAMCNGNDYITIEDDKVELGYFTPAAIDAYNQAWEWYFGATASNVTEETGIDNFIAGKSVMTTLSAWQILSTTGSIAYMMENFGILPYPCGPNADGPNDYKIGYSAADFTICIPSTAKDPEVSAFVIDKIYSPFEGYETEESILDYLSKNYFRDERDSKFFLEMSKNEHAYYHDSNHGIAGIGKLKDSGITRAVEAAREQMITNAKKYLVPAFSTLQEYDEYFHE